MFPSSKLILCQLTNNVQNYFSDGLSKKQILAKLSISLRTNGLNIALRCPLVRANLRRLNRVRQKSASPTVCRPWEAKPSLGDKVTGRITGKKPIDGVNVL
jgi:hypothetical protein